jgi:hypothetical protein
MKRNPLCPARQATEASLHEAAYTGQQFAPPPFELTATSVSQGSPKAGNGGPTQTPAPVPLTQPVHPPLAPIHIETLRDTPDRRGRNRTVVGVGEEVLFTHKLLGKWTASGGRGKTDPLGRVFHWKAPAIASKTCITFTNQSGETNVIIEAIAPTNKQLKKRSEFQFPNGTIAAGMTLRQRLFPLNVSFANLATQELPGPSRNPSGLFQFSLRANPIWHTPSGVPNPINEDNFTFLEDDAMARFQAVGLMDSGGFEFKIPNVYTVLNDPTPPQEYFEETQSTLLEPYRRVTLTKGSESATRKP